MRTVASGNPGGSNGWEGIGREEEVMMAGEGEDEVGGDGGGGEEGVDTKDLGRGEKEEEWGEDG